MTIFHIIMPLLFQGQEPFACMNLGIEETSGFTPTVMLTSYANIIP